MRKFTRIKGENSVSQIRRLPRLGKIRLGVVAKTKTGVEYPREVDHFVCPPEVQTVYGESPKALDIMFPVENEELLFPQFLGAYGSSHKLLCHGDGENAERWNKETKEWEGRSCPCEWLEPQNRKCAKRSNLMVILPKINLGGIYQIDSGSFNSIVNINSYFEYLRFLIGRISWIPIKIIREPQQIMDPEGKQTTHFPIKVVFEGTIDAVNALKEQTNRIMAEVKTYALPEPIIEGPLLDTPFRDAEEVSLEEKENELPAIPGQKQLLPGHDYASLIRDKATGLVWTAKELANFIEANTADKKRLTKMLTEEEGKHVLAAITQLAEELGLKKQ